MVDYTVEYTYEYYDIGGTQHKVELLLLEYSGGSTNIEHADPVPVRMRHTGKKVDFENTIIQGQELIFSFHVPRADIDTWDSLFESDYKDYKLRYYVDSNLEFEGYVKPENLSKQYLKAPPWIRITLSATDALADLKDVPFGNGVVINDTLTILEILKEALTPIGINFDFQIQLGTYESTYMAADECALEQMQIDTRRFFKWTTGKREFMSCWEVIEAVLKDFNIKFKQLKEKYQITCHHELDSYAFIYDWATLTEQSRNVTDNVLDITAYKVDLLTEQQKVRPLEAAGIIFKNKDLGGNITGMDLDDWGNDPPWEIDFSDGSAVAAGVVTLDSDDNTYDDFIETAVFNVAVPGAGEKFLKITFDHILFAHTSPDPLKSPKIKITVTRPDASTEDVFVVINPVWESYESPIHKSLKVVATGNYSVRLSFEQAAGPTQWTTASFKLKKFRISSVINSSEGELLADVIFDEYYKQTSDQGIEVFETDTIVADGGQVTEIGALLFFDSAWHITGAWRTYNHTEDIKLLDIYTRYILDNRYSYKNYLRIKVVDRDYNIDFDKILLIEGDTSANNKDYICISYDRDFRAGIVTLELIELLTIQESYGEIIRTSLNSIDGEQASSSVSVSYIQAEDLPVHNQLGGLQGGQANQYYHLTAAQHTNVGNLDTMAYEAAADYYTAANVDTWRSSVTQQEMDWLHGITSDVQTQITARAIIGANPADNRVATWTNATTLQGETNLTFDGTTLTIGGARPVTIASGLAYIKGDAGGWATGYYFKGSAGTVKGGFGSLGSADALTYYYIGKAHDDTCAVFYPDAAVELYYNDAKKFETSATGATITGDLTITEINNDNQLITTDAAGKLISEANFTFDGTKARIGTDGILCIGQGNEIWTDQNTGGEAILHINYRGEDDGQTQFRDVHISDGKGGLLAYFDGSTGRIGINDSTPSYLFDCNGIGRFTGNLYGDANVGNLSFASGFQGDKWQITEDGDGEFENMFIRGGLTVWELIINRLHYQCGGLIIGAGGGKIATIVDATVGAEVVTFEDPEGNLILPFTEGAIVIMQDFDLNRTTVIKKIVRQVDSINSAGTEITFEATAGWVPGDPAGDDTGIFAVNDEVVAIGHISDAGLDSSIYFSAVDSDNPFMRVFDGVDSYGKWSLGDKTTIKLQLGNLASLASYDIVPADPGYGLYSDNVYLSGLIHALEGSIGGWTIDSEAIYSNDKHAGDDWADESDPGITLMDDGSIHTPNFYVNTAGDVGIRTGTAGATRVEIIPSELNLYEGADLFAQINTNAARGAGMFYCQDGTSEARYFPIGIDDGTDAGWIIKWDSSPPDVEIINGLDVDGNLNIDGTSLFNDAVTFDGTSLFNDVVTLTDLLDIGVNSASGYAAYFFNDGNNRDRWGIGIQCGLDAPGASPNDSYPVKFFDGDGGTTGYIYWDDTTIDFAGYSDISLKENIKDYNISGLDIISRMQYRAFNWKKDLDKKEVHGWIAQEVESIFPEMVKTDPETGLKMISKGRLIPVMMAAIKELNEKVKILEAEQN